MAQAAVATRSATKHYVFGQCEPMKKNQLPLCIDIIRHMYYLKARDTRQRTTPADYFAEIRKELVDIWERALIPIIEEKSGRLKGKKTQSSTIIFVFINF